MKIILLALLASAAFIAMMPADRYDGVAEPGAGNRPVLRVVEAGGPEQPRIGYPMTRSQYWVSR